MTDSTGSHLQRQTVFKSDRKRVYRIPSLFYERESETLLAFAEQRKSYKDASSKHLVMSRGRLKEENNSIEWSAPTRVEKAHLHGHRPMNPCPLYEKTSKTLFLFFICVEGNYSEFYQIHFNKNKARLCYIKSNDGGQSWSEVTDLTDVLSEIRTWATFAVGPGHGIQTESGRLIVPMYRYVWRTLCDQPPNALYLFSNDQGVNWHLSSIIEKESLECEMAEVSDDTGLKYIYCNARCKESYRVEALDRAGFTVLEQDETLVEEGCHGSVVSFPAQSEVSQDDDQSQNLNKWLLFSHPSHKSKRIDLGVYLNETPLLAKTWSKPWIMNSGPSGYSDLAYIGEGRFVCLFECGESDEIEQIASVVFRYSDVKQGIEVDDQEQIR
ncbi:sialidase-3-like [Halichoeres trimaculatus]|uniref:sialidase-3-like n=1 Tax=Halichoeres trimaculatus TaxID=147232 RepID=UPI003D9F0E08